MKMFFYDSGVNTHLAHTHGVPTWELDITNDTVHTSKPMPSHPPSTKEPSVSGSNIESMLGTNTTEAWPNVVECDPNMMGINSTNGQNVMGVNTDISVSNDAQAVNSISITLVK